MSNKGRPRHDTANEVDLQIGKFLRYVRNRAGLSQEALGKKIGVTFQQIQKYENGKNRISASTLHEICQALDVPITDFFFHELDVDEPERPKVPDTPVAKARYQLIRECERLTDVLFIKSLTTFLRALS